jgi:hypothetical protein
VNIASLKGPAVKSHPWKKMLKGRKPEVSALSRSVPVDFYFAEFRSLSKLLHALDMGDLWGKALAHQAVQEARTYPVAARLMKQLALEGSRLLGPLYDSAVEGVAVTGSDLYFREGSDVTVLFRFNKARAFPYQMNRFLECASRVRPDARRTTGKYLGVEYTRLATSDRAVYVYAAYPEPGLHVRSNSRFAFRRVLEAVRGKRPDGRKVTRLGETDEFAYIRTLMPRGAKEEDGFIYLSDPFIRRLVGPQVKLAERRRLLCYNHLKMIGHAALLYRTEYGKWPASLDDLARADCCPGNFNEGALVCPHGGKYTLSADGTHGVCSHHGRADALTPCCELPLTRVNGEEADEYQAFVKDYNEYWKTYFDPIALRMQITPRRYRLETVVLPMIDNTVYSGLGLVLGGKPEPLDALPVPSKNIFSLTFRLNKQAWMNDLKKLLKESAGEDQITDQDLQAGLQSMGVPEKVAKGFRAQAFVDFLEEGLGNQVGLHICDADPMIDFNLPALFGNLLGLANRMGQTGVTLGDCEEMLPGFPLAALFAPAYLTIPVQEPRIVDRFLSALDPVLAAMARQGEDLGGGFRIEPDFYCFSMKAKKLCRGFGVRVGPVKWRVFYARIGGSLYITSKPYILEDIVAAELTRPRAPATAKPAARGPTGHAMLRIRPQHWKRVLTDFRLAWAENNREACLNNLGPVGNVGRALAATPAGKSAGSTGSWDDRGRAAHRLADQLYGLHFFCPEGGTYSLAEEGQTCRCSVHGSVLAPRQPARPGDDSPLARLLKDFADLTATLTFLEDGLRAVVTIDRK